MNYNSKKLPGKIKSKIARRKRNRYHNDAYLFPDNDHIIADQHQKKTKLKIDLIVTNSQ